MMDGEKAFAEGLGRLRRRAKAQGNSITEEQVREEFSALQLSEAQLQMVFDYLEKHGVGIGRPGEPDAGLTEGERDYLQQYLDELAALPGCGQKEKENCILSAGAGDREACRRLTEIYLKDVADIARLYVGQGVPLEDLVGEGNVALAVGIGELGDMPAGADPSETEGELVRKVMDAMEELIRENADKKKTDKRIEDRVNRVADCAGRLAEEYHRKVTPRELVQETGLSMEDVPSAIRMSGCKIEDIEYAKDGI